MRTRPVAGTLVPLVLVLLSLPTVAAALDVKAGEPELLVDVNVTDDTPGSGDHFVTWVDERSGDNEIYIKFLPSGDFYALSDNHYDDNQHFSSGHWVTWIRWALAQPQKGQPLASPSYDIVVYDVNEKDLSKSKEVYQSKTQDRDEWSPTVAGDELAYREEPHDGTNLSHIMLMSLAGSDAFHPCAVHVNDRRQYDPALSSSFLVYRETVQATGKSWRMVAMPVSQGCGGHPYYITPDDPGLGLGMPTIDGDHAAWVETDASGNTTLRVYDLRANRTLASWQAPGTAIFKNLDLRGDLIVAEVVDDSRHNLYGWCLPDGTPAVLPGARPEAILPHLTSWGSVLYLDVGKSPVNLYERYIGCGTLPTPLALPTHRSPGPDVAAGFVVLAVAAGLRRLKKGF